MRGRSGLGAPRRTPENSDCYNLDTVQHEARGAGRYGLAGRPAEVVAQLKTDEGKI
jgi:hypothetical protein